MMKYLFATGVALLTTSCQPAPAQAPPRATYLQVFYEGANWLAGRPLLHYSPAFRGKTDELVTEPDSTARLSPGAKIFDEPPGLGVTTTAVADEMAVGNGNGEMTNYVRGQDGKMRLETAADRQRKHAREKARFDRQLNLVAARGTLARNALTTALNTAAADGWEVVQMSPWGTQGGLVYLLRHP